MTVDHYVRDLSGKLPLRRRLQLRLGDSIQWLGASLQRIGASISDWRIDTTHVGPRGWRGPG